MDNTEELRRPDLRQFTKSRIMGKLSKFGKSKDREEEQATNENDVSDFLRGSSDKLYMTGAPPVSAPPQLAKIDTAQAPRWPTSEEVRSAHIQVQRPMIRKGKGLRVQFTNKWPEVIGYGGEDFEEPSIFISRARDDTRARAQHAHMQSRPIYQQSRSDQAEDFQPKPVRRTQTAHVNMPEIQDPFMANNTSAQNERPYHEPTNSTRRLQTTPSNPNSFAARVKAEIRASEGRDFVQAVRNGHLEAETRGSSDSMRSNTSPGQSRFYFTGTKRLTDLEARTPANRTDSQTSLPIRNNLVPGSSRLPAPPSPGLLQPARSPGFAPPDVSSHSYASNGNGNQRSRSNSATSAQSVQSVQSAITMSVDDQALEDFAFRVQNSYKLFLLSAESVKPIARTSLEEMVRIASWWFLRGRRNIEIAARDRAANPANGGQDHIHLSRSQAHTDLAKALWLVAEIIPSCREIGGMKISDMLAAAREAGEREIVDLLERREDIYRHLCKLTSSMRRNNFLPPTPDEAPLSSGIDNAIWVPPPSVPTDVYPILCSNGYSDDGRAPGRISVALTMPIGDTAKVFNYNRIGVNLILMGDGFEPQQEPTVCIMSVSRRHEDKSLCVFLTDQTGIIDLCIQSDRSAGITWYDVKWQGSIGVIDIKLPRGFVARVQMPPNDFSTLWNLYEQTSRISSVLIPSRDEEVLFDKILKSFQYFTDDPQGRAAFPTDAIDSCYIRLLEKKLTRVAGTGARTTHRGFRVAVMTGPRTKDLNGMSHDLALLQPIRYDFMRGPAGDPTLTLEFREGACKSRMVLAFSNSGDRAKLHHLLIKGISHGEASYASVPLTAFKTTTVTGSSILTPPLESLFSNAIIQVISAGPEDSPNPEDINTIHSENLRVIIAARSAFITDRINVSSGELLIRLPTSSSDHSITIHRQPQTDSTFAIADSQFPRDTPDLITSYLASLSQQPTLRTFTFATSDDLLTFQAAITGFVPLYNGFSTSLAISRRRMVVPVYKKWDSGPCRVQILRQDKITMLCAWFQGWNKGESMNFVLKGTDVYETAGKSKEWGVKLVDAKFSLPRGGEEKKEGEHVELAWPGGISLDSPEYPGEHDDIVLGFESEVERDKFAGALPAPVKALNGKSGFIGKR